MWGYISDSLARMFLMYLRTPGSTMLYPLQSWCASLFSCIQTQTTVRHHQDSPQDHLQQPAADTAFFCRFFHHLLRPAMFFFSFFIPVLFSPPPAGPSSSVEVCPECDCVQCVELGHGQAHKMKGKLQKSVDLNIPQWGGGAWNIFVTCLCVWEIHTNIGVFLFSNTSNKVKL